uniref:ZP domain-containing protein n=1 Tax=Angiostrongylus cantonensis TaxID=6313 RepID=A0A0K0CZH4_ANGCA
MRSLLLIPVVVTSVLADPERHEDHVYRRDDIVELPVGRFPDPDCEYSVLRNGPYGPKVDKKNYLIILHLCIVKTIRSRESNSGTHFEAATNSLKCRHLK